LKPPRGPCGGAELVFDRGHFAYRGYDFSAGPGGMPASPIEVIPRHRFPAKRFLDRFRESAENLDPEVVGWIMRTVQDYDPS